MLKDVEKSFSVCFFKFQKQLFVSEIIIKKKYTAIKNDTEFQSITPYKDIKLYCCFASGFTRNSEIDSEFQ